MLCKAVVSDILQSRSTIVPEQHTSIGSLPSDPPYLAHGYTESTLREKPKILLRNIEVGTSTGDMRVRR